VSGFIARMKATPVTANRVLSCLRKMFNMAEVWGFRDDGTNPCRHIPKYPESGKTRLITDDEMLRLFAYLDRADVEGLEHPFFTLGIRLQFAFAARMSEIINMEWKWVEFVNRRVVWPDSKTGEFSKPMSEEAVALLSTAPRFEGSPYVVPSILQPDRPMSQYTYSEAWKRILERAEIPHVGTHGIRHRATTEIANSGVPVKVGMQLTAHKTVTQFMRYVHTEDDRVRAAAETVASRRRIVISGQRTTPQPENNVTATQLTGVSKAPVAEPTSSDDRGHGNNSTKLGDYRPFHRRSGANQAGWPRTKHTGKARLVIAK
jgi:integrase